MQADNQYIYTSHVTRNTGFGSATHQNTLIELITVITVIPVDATYMAQPIPTLGSLYGGYRLMMQPPPGGTGCQHPNVFLNDNTYVAAPVTPGF